MTFDDEIIFCDNPDVAQLMLKIRPGKKIEFYHYNSKKRLEVISIKSSNKGLGEIVERLESHFNNKIRDKRQDKQTMTGEAVLCRVPHNKSDKYCYFVHILDCNTPDKNLIFQLEKLRDYLKEETNAPEINLYKLFGSNRIDIL